MKAAQGKTRWLGLAVVAGLAMIAAGCGKEEAVPPPMPPAPTQVPGGGTAAPASITQADLDAVAKAGKPWKLALIVKTRNNPFFSPMIKAAEEEAKALGATLEVQAPPQESDKEVQFGFVQTEVARKVDAIMIAPADSKAIVPALKAAQDAGVLVINLDNRVDKGAAEQAGLALGGYVGADNEAGGKLAGEEMAAKLGGQGKVAILEGIRGADNAEARRRGFESAAQGKLDVVAKDSAEWDTGMAYNKFQAMLTAHKDLQGLFCANDMMALGAMRAIQEAGRRGKITVIGYDNLPEVQPYLQSGEMHATIEQHPDLMGRYGVKMAVGVLDGSVPKGREFLVPLEVMKK